jgi:REP element-mobilizing transposase RayT
MSQSLVKNLIHLVFSTQNRAPVLTERIREALQAYISAIFRDLNSPVLAVNICHDHVHIAFILSKNYSLAKVIMESKRGSSKWLKTQGQEYSRFHWQKGYGAFSFGQSALKDTIRYIGRQQEHHRLRTFQDEFREFLNRHEIEYDERYVWD